MGGGITVSMCLSVQAFCSDSILRTAQPFITQLVMVVHHHELECQAKRLVANFKVNVGSYNPDMIVVTISSELVFLFHSKGCKGLKICAAYFFCTAKFFAGKLGIY